MTEEETAEIWRRRKERALAWRRSAGSIADGYPLVGPIEDETEETLSALRRPSRRGNGSRPKGRDPKAKKLGCPSFFAASLACNGSYKSAPDDEPGARSLSLG